MKADENPRRQWLRFSLRACLIACGAVGPLFVMARNRPEWIYTSPSAFDPSGYYHFSNEFEMAAALEAAFAIGCLWPRFVGGLGAIGLRRWSRVRRPLASCLLAIFIGWFLVGAGRIRERRRLMDWINERNGEVWVKRDGDGMVPKLPFSLWLLGERTISVIFLPPPLLSNAIEEQIGKAFPEAQIEELGRK